MSDLDISAVRAVLEQVLGERLRQHAKWGEQNHPDGTILPGDDARCILARRRYERAGAEGRTWRLVLDEEVAEANAAAGAELRAELVQVAAVAVAWVEAIDRRSPTATFWRSDRRNPFDATGAILAQFVATGSAEVCLECGCLITPLPDGSVPRHERGGGMACANGSEPV